jgi:hypothetical protein
MQTPGIAVCIASVPVGIPSIGGRVGDRPLTCVDLAGSRVGTEVRPVIRQRAWRGGTGMNSRTKSIIAAISLAVAAVALFVILSPGDSDQEPAKEATQEETSAAGETGSSQGVTDPEPAPKPPKPKVPTVVFKNGKPVGGVLGIEVKMGEQIKFRVKSDVADEVHVHGFDITRDVPAGGSVSLSFPADITGIYEAEVEHLGVRVAELQINP